MTTETQNGHTDVYIDTWMTTRWHKTTTKMTTKKLQRNTKDCIEDYKQTQQTLFLWVSWFYARWVRGLILGCPGLNDLPVFYPVCTSLHKYMWVILCVIWAHVIVTRPDSFRSERLKEIRIGWLSVRMRWGPSKHFPGQMSLLVCLDSETWLWQMHKPLKGWFSTATPSGACQGLGHWQMCEESHWKHGSFISSPADNSQMLTTGHKNESLTPRPLMLTKLWCNLSFFPFAEKREKNSLKLQSVLATHKRQTHTP